MLRPLLNVQQVFGSHENPGKPITWIPMSLEAAGMARRWRLEFDAASDVAEAMLRSLRPGRSVSWVFAMEE